MKIVCGDVSCKHNGQNGVCEAEKVRLSWHCVQTIHEGAQEFLRCKEYEEAEEVKEMRLSMEDRFKPRTK